VTVDAREGVSTGISAAGRAHTIRLLESPDTTPRDLLRPGHVVPLRTMPGGVLERDEHGLVLVSIADFIAYRLVHDSPAESAV
jgi:3,4-dihydroxy 2-butanone 4-phosphate synthase / GTP cyclohydrolase II